ncbi:glycosyl hydrolase [Aspergillus karnatakaensis]|uniref:glycoside hydrolase family 43 protein n=1 Tax=Aspergillus karnatakaensis TaxID=1810916 RepID=UPI003CCDC1CF
MSAYNNPIIRGFNPDPSVVRVYKDYFLVTSSFEYTPGIPIYHSTDLIAWKLIGHALTRKSQLDIHTPEPGSGIWAATIRWHAGEFYIFSACVEQFRPQNDERVPPQGFYVKTANIWEEWSWSDPVYFDQVGFDQDVFWDDDGIAYLSSTYQKVHRSSPPQRDIAVHICTIDMATGRSTSTPKLLRESSSGVSEGSHLLKRNGFYYLFTAEGGTQGGHSEYVFRNTTGPLGEWEACPHNPLLYNGLDSEVQSTGHADVFEDTSGNWWAVLLAVRPVRAEGTWEESVFGRESFLAPVKWRNDWPIFNNSQPVGLTGIGPGVYKLEAPVTWRDDFHETELQLGWYRKNTPKKIDYSLTERPGFLRLYGSANPLSVPVSPTMFLRKQTHRFISWSTELSFAPTSRYTEAGTVVWWDYYTFSRIGIRLDNDGRRIVQFSSADGNVEVKHLRSQLAEVTLFIDCGDEYRFGYVEESLNEIAWLGSVPNAVMTRPPPVGRPFTGMMLGVYAFGDKEQCLVPADFKYARVEGHTK